MWLKYVVDHSVERWSDDKIYDRRLSAVVALSIFMTFSNLWCSFLTRLLLALSMETSTVQYFTLQGAWGAKCQICRSSISFKPNVMPKWINRDNYDTQIEFSQKNYPQPTADSFYTNISVRSVTFCNSAVSVNSSGEGVDIFFSQRSCNSRVIPSPRIWSRLQVFHETS